MTAAALNSGVGGGGSIRGVRSGSSTGAYLSLPRFGPTMPKRHSEPVASLASPRTPPASAVAAASSKKLRNVVSEVEQPRRRGAGGGGDGSGAIPVKTSARVLVSGNLGGRLAPVTERADLDASLSRVASGGGGSGGEGAASGLGAVRGDGDGDGDNGGGGDSVGEGGDGTATVTSPRRGKIRQRAAVGGARDRDGEGDEAQEGSSRAILPGGESGVAAEIGGSERGGGGGREKSVPSGADVGEGRGRSPGRDLSASTVTTGSIMSRSSSSGSGTSGKEGGRSGVKIVGGGGGLVMKGEGLDKGQKEGDGAAKGGPGGDGAGEEAKRKVEKKKEVLVRGTLCPALEPELLDVALKIFDLDNSGTVTKEVQL